MVIISVWIQFYLKDWMLSWTVISLIYPDAMAGSLLKLIWIIFRSNFLLGFFSPKSPAKQLIQQCLPRVSGMKFWTQCFGITVISQPSPTRDRSWAALQLIHKTTVGAFNEHGTLRDSTYELPKREDRVILHRIPA